MIAFSDNQKDLDEAEEQPISKPGQDIRSSARLAARPKKNYRSKIPKAPVINRILKFGDNLLERRGEEPLECDVNVRNDLLVGYMPIVKTAGPYAGSRSKIPCAAPSAPVPAPAPVKPLPPSVIASTTAPVKPRPLSAPAPTTAPVKSPPPSAPAPTTAPVKSPPPSAPAPTTAKPATRSDDQHLCITRIKTRALESEMSASWSCPVVNRILQEALSKKARMSVSLIVCDHESAMDVEKGIFSWQL